MTEHDDANPPVRVVDATKIYPIGRDTTTALSAVSFSLKRGEMVALVGPSGCGKSTLLNLIGCVDLPTSGSVEICGKCTTGLNDDALTALRRDQVGTVFQSFNLLPALTLAENIAVPLMLANVAAAERRALVEWALDAVGITSLAKMRPNETSGGQQQRASIARALVRKPAVGKPAVLLADEPTGNLDSKNGSIVLSLLRSFADAGQTILMATHSTEAAAVCDWTLTMHDGRIVSAAR